MTLFNFQGFVYKIKTVEIVFTIIDLNVLKLSAVQIAVVLLRYAHK